MWSNSSIIFCHWLCCGCICFWNILTLKKCKMEDLFLPQTLGDGHLFELDETDWIDWNYWGTSGEWNNKTYWLITYGGHSFIQALYLHLHFYIQDWVLTRGSTLKIQLEAPKVGCHESKHPQTAHLWHTFMGNWPKIIGFWSLKAFLIWV